MMVAEIRNFQEAQANFNWSTTLNDKKGGGGWEKNNKNKV